LSSIPNADVLFVGGNVGGPADRQPPGTAVAVAGERIVAVGAEDEVRELRNSRTEVVDLRGRTLLPGFQDAHVHPVWAGLDHELRCDLRDRDSASGYESSSVGGYLDALARYVGDHPDREWVVGSGWSMDVFPGGRPDAATLDQAVSDRPAYLTSRDGHSAWVNSRALEIAGVGKPTADPPDGRIERDEAGRPTGLLHDGAMQLVSRHEPDVSAAELGQGLRYAQRYLHSLGVTAWQDAAVYTPSSTPELGRGFSLPAYLDAADHEELSPRVVGALWWDRRRGMEQLEELEGVRREGWRDRFQPRVVKMMLDGMVETVTASMLDPYCDQHGSTPASFFAPEELTAYVCALDRVGFSVHFHAVGDRATREALDAVEAALKANGSLGHRHQIAHLDVVHPDDQPRFGKLGVIANIQALWACHEPQTDDIKVPMLGPARTPWSFPFRALLDHGARLAAGSDWAVSSPDPLAAIHVAVNRIRPDLSYEPFLPEQRLALADAVAAYTSGSAFANHLDGTGTIRPGYLADLVVLDHDLDVIAPAQLSAVRVDRTYVGGRCVYGSSSSTVM
jgi:predicted amidohydrolase YtcJ